MMPAANPEGEAGCSPEPPEPPSPSVSPALEAVSRIGGQTRGRGSAVPLRRVGPSPTVGGPRSSRRVGGGYRSPWGCHVFASRRSGRTHPGLIIALVVATVVAAATPARRSAADHEAPAASVDARRLPAVRARLPRRLAPGVRGHRAWRDARRRVVDHGRRAGRFVGVEGRPRRHVGPQLPGGQRALVLAGAARADVLLRRRLPPRRRRARRRRRRA